MHHTDAVSRMSFPTFFGYYMKILLAAINAKYAHKALAVYYLKAHADSLESAADIEIREYTINDSFDDVLADIYSCGADAVGFSCYIWNITMTEQLARALRQISTCKILLGGPEVSFDSDYPFADCIIQGEGEQGFLSAIETLAGGETLPAVIESSPVCDLSLLPSPYTDYFYSSFADSAEISRKLIYFEASRGCPFSCSFCISSTTSGVRHFPTERVTVELGQLIDRGAKTIKFVDRTFNANTSFAAQILHWIAGLGEECICTFHFEIAAEIMDEELMAILAKMPVGRVQLEIGVQSVHGDTLKEVGRPSTPERIFQTASKLQKTSNIEVHLDLIAGLPHDSYKTFCDAVNKCLAVSPAVLHIGFLKMLKGARIRREYTKHGFRFNQYAPYEVLSNDTMSYEDIVRIKAIEVCADKFYNTHLYISTIGELIKCANPSEMLTRLYAFIGGAVRVTLKQSYSQLYRFCLDEGIAPSFAEHLIKLDCLSHDPNGQLPAEITPSRRRDAEAAAKQKLGTQNLRAEYFSYDGIIRIFDYTRKSSSNGEFVCYSSDELLQTVY